MTIERTDAGYELRLELPFAERGDVDVARGDDDLLITLGPYRRAVYLPDSLRRREVAGAALRDGVLTVDFSDPNNGG